MVEVDKTCEICGKKYRIRPSHAHKRRTCSIPCAARLKSKEKSGSNHPMWKGGIEKHAQGYILVFTKSRHRKVLLHRKIMEEHLGRKLTPQELVHHVNEDRYDNRIENLRLMTRAEHMNHHRDSLNENKIYRPNSGSFKAGHIPWNKGG